MAAKGEEGRILKENIKAIRKAKGLSQEELAEKLNVVRQTVSKWEQGLSVPDADLLIAISEILETPVGTLLGETAEAIGQSAPKKQGKWNVLFWSMLLLIVGIVLIFAVLLALQSLYLHWDFNDPETAVAGTLLHGFEFLFVRMAPVLLVCAAAGCVIAKKKGAPRA